MEVLADVNVLLALADSRHNHHERSINWFDSQESGSRLLICRVAQMGLLRLLVNSSVMQGEPLTLPQAWAYYGNFIQNPNVSESREPVGLQSKWAELSFDFGSSPKVLAEAYLAAFAISSGFKLVTFDKGFEQFNGLDLAIL
ncbi:MAG: PIN domain-containing protein [Verrucomicrobia bacterium]|nr:PIN domain-containing protein [Verrucomicrobiota bacterium]